MFTSTYCNRPISLLCILVTAVHFKVRNWISKTMYSCSEELCRVEAIIFSENQLLWYKLCKSRQKFHSLWLENVFQPPIEWKSLGQMFVRLFCSTTNQTSQIELFAKIIRLRKMLLTLCEKCPYSEFFWSVFFRIRTRYLFVFSPNAAKCGPEKLQIRILFT